MTAASTPRSKSTSVCARPRAVQEAAHADHQGLWLVRIVEADRRRRLLEMLVQFFKRLDAGRQFIVIEAQLTRMDLGGAPERELGTRTR